MIIVTDHNVIVVPSLDKMSRLDDIESSVSAQLYFVPHYCFPQLLCCFTALISFRQANIPLSCTSNNVDECPLTCCLEPYFSKLVCTALILHLFSPCANKHLLQSSPSLIVCTETTYPTHGHSLNDLRAEHGLPPLQHLVCSYEFSELVIHPCLLNTEPVRFTAFYISLYLYCNITAVYK